MRKIITYTALTITLSFLLAACGQESSKKPNAPTEGSQSIPIRTSEPEIEEQNEVQVSPTVEADREREEEKEEAASEEAENDEGRPSFAGKVAAPEFPVGLDWLNSDRPLSLTDLRGKVVLLDFWTYGCINCIHIIPDLKKLEEKYDDELVVIGVHSAKFTNEGVTNNIRNVILRYELEHPVLNDKDFQVWSLYGANAWPTLVLIDPVGNVLGYHAGEGIYEPFDVIIEGMISEFDEQGLIDRSPLDLLKEKDKQVDSPLLFPGKVLVDSENDRLFIADSNHNRIVITDRDGIVLEVIGSGIEGFVDGSYESAAFFRPQGLTLANDDILYVADTENNAIRRVDLAKKNVATAAGTGEQEYMRIPAAQADVTPLNSPWDVLFHDGKLYIAMAGQHQLWQYDPDSEVISIFAGSGREELKDGPRLSAGLNQPSGLATDGQVLYFADSEASAIRQAEFIEAGDLTTLVGTGLFDFGDVDGTGEDVRLQHPLGVDYRDGFVYVADTYNSKIKTIDLTSMESTTYLGGEESGWRDGFESLFDEPGGLSIGDDHIYIADTNNHVIRKADLENGDVSTLVLIDRDGLLTSQPADAEYTGKIIEMEQQTVGVGNGEIILNILLPDGYKINELAPFSMEWISDNDKVIFDPLVADQQIANPTLPLTIPANLNEGDSELSGELVIYYCEEESQSLCLIERVRIDVPVSIEGGSSSDSLDITYQIPEPGSNIGG